MALPVQHVHKNLQQAKSLVKNY